MKIFITGSAGFIGFHLANKLLKEGMIIHGYDAMNSYYDVSLKKDRHSILSNNSNFTTTKGILEDNEKLNKIVKQFRPDVIVHLAAQAGVLYSLDNPRAYVDSNIIGTFNIMEAAKKHNVKHLLMASTSSVYGANNSMPFNENDKADTQLTIYAATKKANESMAHSYAHLWKLPTTMLRFFTVYGPYGRPDMALFKFVDAILKDKPIDIYNQGEMYRDFTYVDDLVHAISLLIDKVPNNNRVDKDNSLNIAPYRVINIGNSNKVKLLDFIDEIEKILSKKAIRNYMPLQKGDVPATWADCSLLQQLTGYAPNTSINHGVKKFIDWYMSYYNVKV